VPVVLLRRNRMQVQRTESKSMCTCRFTAHLERDASDGSRRAVASGIPDLLTRTLAPACPNVRNDAPVESCIRGTLADEIDLSCRSKFKAPDEEHP
jgi:hypothetical protein